MDEARRLPEQRPLPSNSQAAQPPGMSVQPEIGGLETSQRDAQLPVPPPPPREEPPPVLPPAAVLPEKQGPPLWPFLLFLALLLVAVIGGYLFSRERGEETSSPRPTIRPFPTPNPTVAPRTFLDRMAEQGTSDAIEAIEEDVNATDLTGIDDGLETIETELQNL